MKLVFHVGMPKCGTSTLQNSCRSLAGKLEANGVLYPDFKEFDPAYANLRYRSSGNGNPFVYLQRMRADPSVSPDLDRHSVFESLARQVAEAAPELVVLSHEDMINMSVDDMLGIAAELGLQQADVRVILHIRRHDLWLASDYQQHIRQLRSNIPIERHVARRLRSLQFSDICERFAAALGASHVIVRLLDHRTMQGNLLEDFFAALGHAVPGIRDIDLVDSNEGMAGAFVPILLLANAKGVSDAEFRHLLRQVAVAQSAASDLPSFRLPQGLAMLVSEYFEDDRRRLNRFLSEAEQVRLAERPPGWSDTPILEAETEDALRSMLQQGLAGSGT